MAGSFRGLYWIALGLASACGTRINKDPNVLNTPEFADVAYLPSVNKAKVQDHGQIEVVNSGFAANILNTVPGLYRKAQKEFGAAAKEKKSKVYLAGIDVTAYTRREPFQVPYQDCQTNYTSRIGYGGRYESQPTTTCTTKYRTEIRDVLYQRATANVYTRKDKAP